MRSSVPNLRNENVPSGFDGSLSPLTYLLPPTLFALDVIPNPPSRGPRPNYLCRLLLQYVRPPLCGSPRAPGDRPPLLPGYAYRCNVGGRPARRAAAPQCLTKPPQGRGGLPCRRYGVSDGVPPPSDAVADNVTIISVSAARVRWAPPWGSRP